MFCNIYKITNMVNGKIYIGQTWKTLGARWKGHLSASKIQTWHFSRAISKYGPSSFRVELITVCHTQAIADYWETYFIEKYNTNKTGYNTRSGGSRGKIAESTKVKLSLALRGNKNGLGNTNALGKQYHLGFKVSDEGKKKMSLAKLGKPGFWAGKKRKPHSEETKRKMSESHQKRKKL